MSLVIGERLAWTVGVVSLAIWTFVNVSGTAGARRELSRFAELQTAAREREPDLRLWSPERVRAWRDTLKKDAGAPLAVLRVPKINLEVAVLKGTDDWTLNRAVGHIEETAVPGADGNAGLAGHRDGFFRGLKDIVVGDLIEIDLVRRVDVYRVERIWIVDPEDVSVLDPTSTPSITLVTCYPFYFVGSAPQRYIVRAVRTRSRDTRP